jgi:hypothetical protein
MKRQLCFTLWVILLATFSNSIFAGTYSGGTGEPNDPYQIADVNDLLALAADTNDYNECFILTADVNMEGQVFTTAIIAPDTDNSNYGFDGTAFTGTFDGNGHKITGFTINPENNNKYIGLFGQINYGGSVKNLGLENFIGGDSSYVIYVGGLVGQNYYGSIRNCYSKGSVRGVAVVGGLVGWNAGSIINCYSTGSVSGSGDSGGLAGDNYGSIINCYSTGQVSGYEYTSSWRHVGGLVGWNAGSIINCYTTGQVSGYEYVGGLVGWNQGIISNCYSKGAASGDNFVGGLVGIYQPAEPGHWGSIDNCYATGRVTGSSNVGGLLGDSYVAVNKSFWDIETSGQTSSASGEGKTTAEMKQINTFTNWDFVETWGIEDNQTYPFLKLTYPVGDLNYDKVVNFLDLAILASRWLEGAQ